jgi:hypothetical protein
MELSQTSPQIVRNKTPEDHQGYNWRHRNRELFQQGKFYFCKGDTGTRAQHTEGQAVSPSLCSWHDWPCLLSWIGPDQKFTIFSVGWNSVLIGGGVKIHSVEGNFHGQRGLARIRKNPELQTVQVIKWQHTLW